MKRIGVVGLCLLATFAFTATAASSASAAELGVCVSAKHGKWENSKCTVKARKAGKGKFEFHPVGECYATKKGFYTESKCATVAEKNGKPDHKGAFNLAVIPPPAGSKVISKQPSKEIGGVKLPTINSKEEAEFEQIACPGGTVSVTVIGKNTKTGQFEERSFSMTESPPPPGRFIGHFPMMYPVHGLAAVVVKISHCANPEEEGAIGFTIYIDPSGLVLEGSDEGPPVAGATVTLLAGSSLAGPFTKVPEGSEVMSPENRTNPQTTGPEGAFGWETIAGFYEVRAEKAGCGSATTPAFEVPPVQEELVLVLDCEEELGE